MIRVVAAEWFGAVILQATAALVAVLTAGVVVLFVTLGVGWTFTVGEVLSTDLVAALPVPVVAMRHFVAGMVLVVLLLAFVGVVVWLMATGVLTALLVGAHMAGACVSAV